MADREPSPATRVVLRPLGSPLSLGLAGLGVVSLLMGGFDLGWLGAGAEPQVGLLVIVTAVPLLALAAIFSLLARDGAVGGAMALQGAVWAGMGLMHVIAPAGTSNPPIGLLLVGAGLALTLAGATNAVAKVVVGAEFGLSGFHFLLVGLYELGAGAAWEDAGGAVSLLVAVVAGYGSWAAQLEDLEDRELLPTGRRGPARAAMRAPYAAQVDDVAREAGVRRQL